MIKVQNSVTLIWLTLLVGLHISCKAQTPLQKLKYDHPIEIKPETYLCHFTNQKIEIDGLDSESQWKDAPWSNEFVDIEGDLKPHPAHPTRVKMLWDTSYFYFYAKMEEPHIWATLKNRDDIMFKDDDFEIFIDPDGDSHNYYEFEWNAFNALWDLILLKPYRVDNQPKVLFEWNVIDIHSAVHIEGSLNDASDEDKFWSIEIAIPWYALKEFSAQATPPLSGDQWRVNFSRVDWTMDNDGKGYQKRLNENNKQIPPDNWVWSPTGRINMHMPEMWGFVEFIDKLPSSTSDNVQIPKDEQIKWALWNMYWQQLDYYKKHKTYTTDLNNFTIPTVEECSFEPTIHTTPYYFEITNPSCQNTGTWVIQKEGKIYLNKN